jgi:glycosyltransferase involved in cell wall biosynthesis
MKLLISAYVCAPNRGSEHGVGWNWTTEAHRLGHEIWALTSPAHRDAIENAARGDAVVRGIHWAFPELSCWALEPGKEPGGMIWGRTYNLFWQRAALRVARELQVKIGFDAIHHLTWAGIRAPTFLGSLGPPLIVGPIGGGETCPSSLRDGLGFQGRVFERMRDLSNSTIAMNPIVRPGLTSASVIFVSTTDTQNVFDGALRNKTLVFTQLGLPTLPGARSPRSWSNPPRFLYAGRLLYWKGVHIAVRAFAEVVRQTPSARFTIVGDGPERSRLETHVKQHNLQANIEFIPQVPQNILFELYESHDLLLFPSLHDSGAFVVLEALSRGLPVICLDLGGPKDMVTPNSGIVIQTNGQNTAQVAAKMAVEISRLLAYPQRLTALSAGAVSRAREFILAKRIEDFYNSAMSFITQNN